MQTAEEALKQRQQALVVGNHVRTWRVQLRKELRGMNNAQGREHVAQLLLTEPMELNSLSVEKLLTMVQYFGHQKMSAVLRRTNLSGMRQCGSLTERQRNLLALELVKGCQT